MATGIQSKKMASRRTARKNAGQNPNRSGGESDGKATKPDLKAAATGRKRKTEKLPAAQQNEQQAKKTKRTSQNDKQDTEAARAKGKGENLQTQEQNKEKMKKTQNTSRNDDELDSSDDEIPLPVRHQAATPKRAKQSSKKEEKRDEEDEEEDGSGSDTENEEDGESYHGLSIEEIRKKRVLRKETTGKGKGKKKKEETFPMRLYSNEDDKRDQQKAIRGKEKEILPEGFGITTERRKTEEDFESLARMYGVGQVKKVGDGQGGREAGYESDKENVDRRKEVSKSLGTREAEASRSRGKDDGDEDGEGGEDEEDENEGEEGDEEDEEMDYTNEDMEIGAIQDLMDENGLELDIWDEFKNFVFRRRKRCKYSLREGGGGRRKTVVDVRFRKMLKTFPNLLKEFARVKVFKECKFFLDEKEEKAYCLKACREKFVSVEEGLHLAFADSFHGIMADQIKDIRQVSSQSAAKKVRGDLMGATKRVPDPENFEHNLFENYRDYLDENGELLPEREKNYEAFEYFVNRILKSVNTRQTRLGSETGEDESSHDIMAKFTVSDEAFALVLVQNYYEKWKKQSEETSREKWKQVPGRWTSSEQGNKAQGWDDDGIEAFFTNCEMVEKKRGEKRTGELVDQLWRDRQLQKQGKSKRKSVKIGGGKSKGGDKGSGKQKKVRKRWQSKITQEELEAYDKKTRAEDKKTK